MFLCTSILSRDIYGLIEAQRQTDMKSFCAAEISNQTMASLYARVERLIGGGEGGGYARRAKRRRRAYFGFLSKIPRRGHVNCITIKRPRFPRNKIWRWRRGPKGHDEAAGRLGSRAAGLVVVEEPIRYRERESWLLPHSGRPIADWPPSSSSLLLFLFLRSIKIRRKFLFFFVFYYAHSKVVRWDNTGDSLYGKQPSNVSAALSSPKTFNKQGGLGTCNRAI